MLTIREIFHKVGNLHNKISIAAGVTKGELEYKFTDKPLPPEIEKTLGRLAQIERCATEAGGYMNQLNDIIYDAINPDTGKPR